MKGKERILALAIAIVFVFFVGYGIEVFHQAPERTDYCPDDVWEKTTKETCEEAGGIWRAEDVPQPIKGQCTQARDCYEAFEKLMSTHDKIVFIVALIISIVMFIIATQLKNEPISIGLMGGSLLLLLYGTIRYWRHANDIIKFVLLGIALAALIYIALKIINKKKLL